MAKKLDSYSSLTEFAPLSPDAKTEAFSIGQIFWKSKEKPNANIPKASDQPIDDSTIMNPPGEASPFQPEKDLEIPPIDKNRGMSGILSKIMHNIVDKKKKGLQSYKDSDFKQYWMPDSNCKECYDCGDKFTTFRRKHHCRLCGQIFCRRCCSQEIPGYLIGYTGDLRVCSYCYRTVLSYVSSLDSNPSVDDNLHSLIPSQSLGFSMDPSFVSSVHVKNVAASTRRKSSVIGFREEDIAKAKSVKPVLSSIASPSQSSNRTEGQIQEKMQLKKLLAELMVSVKSVPLWKQDYKDHHTKLIVGSDIVDWLMEHNPSLLRNDAVNIGQAFIDAELIECIIPQQSKFVDGNILYKPLEIPPFEESDRKDSSVNEIQESMEPLWVKEIAPAESYTFRGSTSELNKEPSEGVTSPTTPRFSGSLSRFSSSNSMFYLDLDVKESRVSIFKTSNPDENSSPKEKDICDNSNDSTVQSENDIPSQSLDKFMDNTLNDSFMKALNKDNFDSTFLTSVISSKKWHYSQLREDNGEKVAFENLNLAYKYHEETLLNQLLSAEGLSLSWCDVILPIIYRVVNSVHPDVKKDADDMDIRQYIQFKKIPGGNKSESSIISGVVFSKTVAHKKMRQSIQNPTVLLLSSAISYQRVENKLSSLDPIMMQEFEYLKNTIGKLTVIKPDILLVEKTVSRLAQEMLLSLGVTVVLNVKPSVMERIARGTKATIMSTIDAHLGLDAHHGRPKLGSCNSFYVKSYFLNGGRSKTLMFLDGCPENLGCTILLRGGSGSELKKVKQVVQFMIYAAYNWHLERSFLMDEFAFLPSASSTYADSKLSEEETKTKSNEAETSSIVESSCVKKSKPRTEEVGRKLEAQSISDFSDPLHSLLQEDNDVFQESAFKVDKIPTTDTFKKLLSDIVLSCSISVKIPLPFLETDAGKKCSLRKFFPQEIYWSRHFTQTNEFKTLQEIDTQMDLDEESASLKKGLSLSKNVELRPNHKFVSFKIVDFLNSSLEMQSVLADFRARGGTIKYLCPHERKEKDREKEKKYISDSIEKEKPQSSVHNNTGLCWEKKTDALDPNNHQTLTVLFSSYSCTSDNAPNYCVNPWVVKMEFYGSNDITLGGFLEKYCFRSSYICPSATCVTPMTEHIRKFVHVTGCVHILLHELNTGLQASEKNILMWSWCHKCLKATPVVSMSDDTWSFSFAKYLELRFYAIDYRKRSAVETCSHSLHHDHYQYFAQNQSVAIFKYTPVFIWEVAFPALVIPVNDKAISVTSLVEKIKVIATKGHEIYSDILTMLYALHNEYSSLSLKDFIDDMINMLKLEILPFRAKIEEIQLRLTSPTIDSLSLNSAISVEQNKDVCNFMWKIEDQVVLLKYHIAEVVQVWNYRIQEFISARKKEQKLQTKLTHQINRASEENSLPKSDESQVEEKISESPSSLLDIANSSNENFTATFKVPTSHALKIKPKFFGRCLSYESIFTNYDFSPVSSLTKSKSEEKVSLSINNIKELQNSHERKMSIFSCDSSYIYGVTPGIYAGLKAPGADDDESYIICHRKDNQEKKASKSSRPHHERSKSETEAQTMEAYRNAAEKYSTTDSAKPEKRTMMGILSQFLSSSTGSCCENPFAATEHLLLPQSPKIPIIVHEEEPSSLIAYTLASAEYEQKLQELKQNLNTLSLSQKDSQASSPLLKHKPNLRLSTENASHTDGPFSSDDAFDFTSDSVDKSHAKTNKASNLHLEIQFTDTTTRFYCRVYYAEQFRKLRSTIFPEGEERYIRSLSHCVQWMARGGKSGSMFCKTHDDRFILKQMPRLELQSFMDLAPAYIQYLNKAFLEQKPTLLAKIVGIYRISFKNTATNAATKMDLLVMENLFYNRCVSKKYDLKGSIRNRLVNTSGVQEEDIVLLDENLLKITCDNPLYIRPHCKTVLTLAISNDTQFLVDQSVMDYSLLVGLDEEKGELVVGIIDYIRTFTWDKKVEMIIKSSGILGGHGKLPTVVSPELYKIRFCDAMDSYFLWIPDRWTGLGKGVDG